MRGYLSRSALDVHKNTTLMCVAVCPTNSFGENTTRICVAACPSGSLSYPQNTLCVFECPIGYYAYIPTQFCMQTCSTPYYGDPSTHTCVAPAPSISCSTPINSAEPVWLLVPQVVLPTNGPSHASQPVPTQLLPTSKPMLLPTITPVLISALSPTSPMTPPFPVCRNASIHTTTKLTPIPDSDVPSVARPVSAPPIAMAVSLAISCKVEFVQQLVP